MHASTKPTAMDGYEHKQPVFVRRSVLQAFGFGGLALLVPTACKVPQGTTGNYPAKPIDFIIPFSPGGSTDPLGRQYVSGLRTTLKAKVTPLNRSGGGGTVGMGAVVKAKADGYTLGLSDDAGLALQPHINRGLPWKTEDDYFAIGKLADVPGSLAVRSDADWRSLDDLIAYARQHPGEVTIGSSGKLDITDIEAQQFGRVANIKIRTVPSSGGGAEALTNLLGGRIDAVNGTPATLREPAKAGKIRVLGSFYPTPLPIFDAPSIVEAGYDVTLPSKYGIIGPKGMPKSVQDELLKSYREVVKGKDFKKFLKENGYIGDAKAGDEFSKELRSDYSTYGKLVRKLDLA